MFSVDVKYHNDNSFCIFIHVASYSEWNHPTLIFYQIAQQENCIRKIIYVTPWLMKYSNDCLIILVKVLLDFHNNYVLIDPSTG